MTDWLKTERDKWREALVRNGHMPRVDSDGDIDMFAMDREYHNGPGCETCGEMWYHHCTDPSEIEPCTRPVLELTAQQSEKK